MEFFALFIVNTALSIIVAYVAKSKQRSPIAFFFLSFFFSFFVGILVALAISPGSVELMATTRCEHCKEVINAEATTCKHCGNTVIPNAQAVEEKQTETEDTKRGTQIIYGAIWALIAIFLLVGSIFPSFNIFIFILFLIPAAFSAFNFYKAFKSLRG